MSVERTAIERWIHEAFQPERTDTAELAYERMESQSGECLPVLYGPLDHTRRMHWHDEALCSAIAHALGRVDRVLDIGPGDGWPSLRIADRFDEVVGIDPSPRRVRVQRENAERLGIRNVEFSEMDAVSLDFPDASFGGVVAASAIEQTNDPPLALREVFRVLKPGGAFVMIYEDYDAYFPDSNGDEEVWVESLDGDTAADCSGERYSAGASEAPVVFYQARTKAPPRESRYAFFLRPDRLSGDAAAYIESLGSSHERVESSAAGEKHRPAALRLSALRSLAPAVREVKYFDLSHFSASTVGLLLKEAGFTNGRYLDHRMEGVLALFDGIEGEGRLDEYRDSFVALCRDLGADAIERAGDVPGDFVVAEKPGGSEAGWAES